MDTDHPARSSRPPAADPATSDPATSDPAASGRRSAGLPALAATYVIGVVLLVVQSVAYHHYAPTDGTVGQDVGVYVVSGLIGTLIAAMGLFRVARSRRPTTAPRVGIVLSVLGLVIFPVAYYTPLTFIWGVTSVLLSRSSQPGRSRTAARVLGIVALCLTPVVVLLRAVGVTDQLGG